MIQREILDADATDHSAIIATLSDAFMTDPAFGYIVPDAFARAKMLPRFFALMVRDDSNKGTIMRSSNDEAAALWRSPGNAKDNTPKTIALLISMIRLFGFGLGRAGQVADALESHLPSGRYHYLHFVGVRAASQGKGWGGAIIREGIKRADADGLPCWLETSTPENVGLYQRLGFATRNEWDVGKKGLHFWGMMRDPQ